MTSSPGDPDYKLIFETAPALLLVLDPEFRVVAANEAYLAGTMTVREEIVGRSHFEIFPANDGDPNSGPGNVRASFERVVQTKKPDPVAVQKYDIPKRPEEGGGFEERFWSAINVPVLDRFGNLVYIIHRAEDITDLVRLKKRGENVELEVYQRAQEVQDANRKLREAERAKSDFVANMSHEIRTPLNGVIGLTDILLNTQLDESQRSYMTMIKDSGASLLTIVNDILDFSKIEAGKLELNETDFSPIALIESHARFLRPKAESKGLALITNVAPNLPEILHGDSGRLGQVLLNFIGNAIKFTENGSIVIGVDKCGDDRVLFSVKDSGIGIQEKDRTRLFRPFTQADSSMTRKYGGTGLGLSISKQLVELMRGEIGVDSRAGHGSVFWFKIPLTAGQAIQPAAVTPVRPFRETAKGTVKPLVLLVEDNGINQIVGTAQLNAIGCDVHVAANGRKALAAVTDLDYDLVLMDCQMPEMDGFEATRAIRALEARTGRRRIPIIALTANAMKGDEERCLACGMDGYLAKPVVEEQLVAMLEQWLPR